VADHAALFNSKLRRLAAVGPEWMMSPPGF
jgi:hypothetical protein